MQSRINEATVTLNTVVTVACWLVGIALMLVSFLPAVHADLKPPTCTAALIFALFGATRWIAHMLCELERSQLNAFELGRDYEASDRLRSVK